MRKLWRISSDSGFNSVVTYSCGLVLNSDSEFKPDNESFFAIGPYAQCMKLASWTRNFWIRSNQYNPIRVDRLSNRTVVYRVIPKCGMTGYEMMRIEPLNSAPEIESRLRMDDLHGIICYKSYNDDAPLLIIGSDRVLLLNRHNPAEALNVVYADRDRLMNDGVCSGHLTFQRESYFACTVEQSRAICALASAFNPVNLFLA